MSESGGGCFFFVGEQDEGMYGTGSHIPRILAAPVTDQACAISCGVDTLADAPRVGAGVCPGGVRDSTWRQSAAAPARPCGKRREEGSPRHPQRRQAASGGGGFRDKKASIRH